MEIEVTTAGQFCKECERMEIIGGRMSNGKKVVDQFQCKHLDNCLNAIRMFERKEDPIDDDWFEDQAL